MPTISSAIVPPDTEGAHLGWIPTVDAAGRPNLAPYSFFNAFCEAPPLVGLPSGGRKDSQRNAEATGEFVVNLATRGHGGDEPDVGPPRVADVPAALECRVVLILPLQDLDGRPRASTLVLGQVVGVHIASAFLRGGLFDLVAAGTVARCGYRGDYTQVTSLFEMPRPTAGEADPARSG
jgi:flavin reductase (DIM6/NTAB) family NADH-FMN oxidoreductase RutF